MGPLLHGAHRRLLVAHLKRELSKELSFLTELEQDKKNIGRFRLGISWKRLEVLIRRGFGGIHVHGRSLHHLSLDWPLEMDIRNFLNGYENGCPRGDELTQNELSAIWLIV